MRAWLLHSSRSQDEVIYRAELEDVARLAGVEVIYTFSRAQPPGWTGSHRRMDEELLLREVVWPA
ncbi:MAG TPA: hypothetical protein VKW09_16040 [bacterium]|nr:hypothetical protein [bacterium]